MKIFSLYWLMISITVGCSAEDMKPRIVTSVYPIQFVCEQLVGDYMVVTNLTDKVQSPRDWKPDEAALNVISSAEVVILNGGGYENWAGVLVRGNIFYSSEAVLDKYGKIRNLEKKTQEGFHDQVEGLTWLDPLHLKLQSVEIAKNLKRWVPKEELNKNLRALSEELDELSHLLNGHERLEKERILGLHPAVTGCVGPGYGLRTRSVTETLPGNRNPEGEKLVMEVFEYFPARVAISIGELPADWERHLQKWLRIHTYIFETAEVKSDQSDFLSTMKNNILQLKSLYHH